MAQVQFTIYKWRLPELFVFFVQPCTCADDSKFAHKLITFCVRSDIGGFQAALYCLADLLAVCRNSVAFEVVNRKELVVQCEKYTRDHEGLVLILQRSVCT